MLCCNISPQLHLTLRQAPVHSTSLFSCKSSEHRPRVLPKAFQRTWLGNWVHVATIPGSCPRHSAGLHRGEGLIAHAVASSRLTDSSGAAYALASTTSTTTTLSQTYTRTRAMAQQHPKEADTRHLSEEKRRELDEKARQGETVVPGGTGGKSLEAQERLAEGRSRGGQTRSEQLGTEGYEEMGRKGGLSSSGKSSEEVMAEKGVDIDESKFKNKGQ